MIVDELVAVLGYDIKNPQAVNQFLGKLDRIGRRAREVGRSMSLRLTAPIAAIGVAGFRAASGFESAMLTVQGVTKATDGQLKTMTAQARALGESTVFTATQVGGAMEFLGMAGLNAQKITGALPDTLDLAAASGMGLAETADVITNIMTGYRMETSQLAKASDVMVGTFTSSNVKLEELGRSLRKVGGIARSSNVPFEQTAAMIGIMGNAGIKAEEAGTALRNVLIRAAGKLGDSTEGFDPSKAARLRKAYGIDFYTDEVDKDGNRVMKDFIGIAKEMEPYLNNKQVFSEVFGLRAGPHFQTMLGQGVESIEALEAHLKAANGEAKALAEKKMSGATGSWKRFASAVEGLNLAIADSGVLESIGDMLKTLTGFVRYLAQASPGMLKFGAVFAFIAAAVGPAILGLGYFLGLVVFLAKAGLFVSIAGHIGMLSGAISFLTAAIAANPIGALIIGIIALVAAGVWMVKNWDTVKEWWMNFSYFLADVVVGTFNLVKDTIFGLGKALYDFFFKWDGAKATVKVGAENELGDAEAAAKKSSGNWFSDWWNGDESDGALDNMALASSGTVPAQGGAGNIGAVTNTVTVNQSVQQASDAPAAAADATAKATANTLPARTARTAAQR